MCCNHIVLAVISRWNIRDSYDQRYCFVERYNRVFSDLSDKLGKLMDPSLNGNTQEGNLEKMAIYYNFRNNKTQNFRSYKMIKRKWHGTVYLQFSPPRKPMKSSMHIPVIKTDVLARALTIEIAKLKYTNRLMSARIITIGAGATSITWAAIATNNKKSFRLSLKYQIQDIKTTS